jgi:hypothetical protein
MLVPAAWQQGVRLAILRRDGTDQAPGTGGHLSP